MPYSIGPKIGIDGEKEFRDQIRNINTEYKTLEAETKALTAAFEANGDEQGKLEGTAKLLEKQIDSQKRKMDLLEDAVKKASDKYGENSVEANRLRGALYDTQATVTNLENELKDTNQRLNESGAAMSEAEMEAAQMAESEAKLKNQLSDTEAEYKAIVAETKALAASYENADNQTDNLRTTSQQLEKQIESQKKRIDLLKSAVEIAAKKYGENSAEANKMRASLYDAQATVTGLENELKDTNKRLEESANGMEEFREETEGAGDAALDFKDIVGANFISDVAVDLLHELEDAVVEFAKEAPEAAADVNAANSQFEQTFGELESTAKSALQSIYDETGITVTRMQGDYTKLYAFTKTAGADSELALDISGRAMLAAADNAAYYDKSIEEVTEQLQSFLKGNYENDAALGISATETTRNAKANEMYAVSFDKLSESQKIDVLLAMVEAGNAASGALGQAAREADSWTNVQGELDEAMKQFQATLGQPVLEAVIPIIQNITASIYELIDKPDWKVLESGIDDFVNSMESANAQFETASAEAESSAHMAERYVKRLGDLEAAGLDTAESQREYANVVGHLNELYPELNLQIDENTGLTNKSKDAILGEIDAMKQKALYVAMEERYTTALKAQADATLAVRDAEYALTGIEEQRQDLEEQLTAATGMTSDQLIQLYNNQMMVNSAMQAGGDAAAGVTAGLALIGEETAGLTPAQMEQVEQLIQLQTEEDGLNRTIAEGEETIASYDDELIDLEKTLDQYADGTKAAATSQDTMTEKTQEVEQTLSELETAYNDAVTAARESIDSQIGLFDELATESEMTTQEIIANWQNQQAAFSNYSTNLQKAVDMGLDQALIKQLADGSEQSMLILQEMVNGTEVRIDEINAAFQGLNEARDTASRAMENVTSGIKAEMDKVADNAETWGIDIVNGAVAGIDANAYLFSNSMRSMASHGEKAFREAMVMHSPSRLMIEDNEDVVAGAVIGIERNIDDYETVMSDLGSAGYLAYLDERISIAEDYPNIMGMPSYSSATSNSSTVNYGGINVNIYQRDGESDDALVERVIDALQTEIIREEGAF